MKKEPEMFRQGDLLFVKSEIPKKGRKIIRDGVIARGETTGHTHRIRSRIEATLLLVGTALYVRARQDTHIDHEDHDTVILPPGGWQVTRQQEYTPAGWRQVSD